MTDTIDILRQNHNAMKLRKVNALTEAINDALSSLKNISGNGGKQKAIQTLERVL